MIVRRLEVENVRNIEKARLEPDPNINLIFGPNGSGKTALLEALYLLGSGRSFRARQIKEVIREGQEELTVFGVIQRDTWSHRLGVKKDKGGKTQAAVDGERLASSSRLAERLAVQVVTPETVRLIDGQAEDRRAFLDWGVFHVEPRFHREWADYRKSLEQRNRCLRMQRLRELDAWDAQLVAHGSELDRFRRAHASEISSRLKARLAQLDFGAPLEVGYASGWRDGEELADALERNRQSDLEAGYTSVGPHRADIVLRSRKERAARMLSRGQKKLLVYALLIAQVELIADTTGKKAVLLLDDLPSELDEDRRTRVVAELSQLGCQLFITSVDKHLSVGSNPTPALFHVEHGMFEAVV